ncbi:MAG: CGNR zinc finger domain-containing protein [Gemmatimonadales bacterium]
MAHPFILLGDALWLDFVNSDRGCVPTPPDLLPDHAAYVRWCEIQCLVPDDDPAAFPRTREFRTQLTALAEAMHGGRQPSAGPIAGLNEILAHSTGSRRLTRVGGTWRLQFQPSGPLRALEAIAGSAAATLAETRTAVRCCSGETCSLFFTDDSPTGNRRWCDALACGGQANVERRRVRG